MRGLITRIVTYAALALAFMLPVCASVWMSYRLALSEQQLHTGILAAEVLYRVHVFSEQNLRINAALRRHGATSPCSPDNVALMRNLAVGASYLQVVGYVEGNVLQCSSYGYGDVGIPIGPPAYRSRLGKWVRTSVKLPFDESRRYIALTDSVTGYSSLALPDMLLDTGGGGRGFAIALVAISNRQIVVQRDPIDLDGMPPLIRERGTITWQHRGATGSVSLSPSRDYAAVVMSPASALHTNWRNFAMWLVPFGALLGGALAALTRLGLRRRHGLLRQLDRALRDDELSLAYMPIVELESGKWIGAKALMRWCHDGQWIPPDKFIPLAERHHRIRKLTNRMLDLLVADAQEIPRDLARAMYFSVNLSAEDLAARAIAQRVADVRQACGVDGVMVEATEGVLLEASRVIPNIERLRKLGIRVAIDDFGTGYSSLSYLGSLDVDYIKIDKSFVSAIGTNSVRGHVVAHIIDMAKDVGVAVIAEGVETQEQADYLMARGVRYAQGWLFGKAMPMQDFVSAIRMHNLYYKNCMQKRQVL